MGNHPFLRDTAFSVKAGGIRPVQLMGSKLGSTGVEVERRDPIGSRKLTVRLNVNDNEPATAHRIAA